MKPNFLFIGPDKTGSSWIYDVLRQHPQCYLPYCKDIYYFDRYYDRGPAWYSSFFEAAPPRAKAVGEICHDYLFSPLAAARIHRDLPGVKLFTCLRDPVERTFSNYLYLTRSGWTRLTFEEALEKYPTLIDNSLYHKHLSEYFQLFEPEQLKVLFYDLLKSDPADFARELCDYLGISYLDDLDYGRIVRPAGQPRVYLLARLARLGSVLARNAGLTRLVGAVKHSPLAALLYKPYEQNERPVISPASRTRLRNIFHDDILKLQDMLDVDLTHWLGTPGEQPNKAGAGSPPGEERMQLRSPK